MGRKKRLARKALGRSGGLSRAGGNNQTVRLSGQNFQTQGIVTGASTLALLISPSSVASTLPASLRLVVLSDAFNMYRFTRFDIKIQPNTLVAQNNFFGIAYQREPTSNVPGSAFACSELAFARTMSGSTTVPEWLHIPRSALMGGETKWLRCDPVTAGAEDTTLWSQGKITLYTNGTGSTTVQISYTIFYTIEFKDPSPLTTQPPDPMRDAKALQVIRTEVSERKAKHSALYRAEEHRELCQECEQLHPLDEHFHDPVDVTPLVAAPQSSTPITMVSVEDLVPRIVKLLREMDK
jgi:hypothetical protein